MKYIKTLMAEKKMTRSMLSRLSAVPESTLRDILNGKAQLDRCEALTLMCIAEVLDTSVEDILVHYWEETEEKKLQQVFELLNKNRHSIYDCSDDDEEDWEDEDEDWDDDWDDDEDFSDNWDEDDDRHACDCIMPDNSCPAFQLVQSLLKLAEDRQNQHPRIR